MAAGAREAAAFIVGADEAGTLWLWPNRAPHHVKSVKYVRKLADRDGALADGAAITACKTSAGMIASGFSNGRVTLWSLTAGKVVLKVDEIDQFRTRTGNKGDALSADVPCFVECDLMSHPCDREGKLPDRAAGLPRTPREQTSKPSQRYTPALIRVVQKVWLERGGGEGGSIEDLKDTIPSWMSWLRGLPLLCLVSAQVLSLMR